MPHTRHFCITSWYDDDVTRIPSIQQTLFPKTAHTAFWSGPTKAQCAIKGHLSQHYTPFREAAILFGRHESTLPQDVLRRHYTPSLEGIVRLPRKATCALYGFQSIQMSYLDLLKLLLVVRGEIIHFMIHYSLHSRQYMFYTI